MLRHVVLLTWKHEVVSDERSAILNELGRIVETLPGATAAAVSTDLGLTPGAADAALSIDFFDADAWRAYQDSPAHRRFVNERLGPSLAARTAIQIDHSPSA